MNTSLAIALTVCLASVVHAQEPQCVIDGMRHPSGDCSGMAARRAPADDPLGRYLFPPELVMAHQQEINLTDRQRLAIQTAMKAAQGKFIDLQFQMSGEVEKMQRIVQATSVDEAKMLEQLDRVLVVEREVKHAQLTLMILIKNQLTEQQQAVLGKLRP